MTYFNPAWLFSLWFSSRAATRGSSVGSVVDDSVVGVARADTSESSPCSLVGWFSACLGSSGASTTGARSTVSSMGSVPEGFAGFSCRVLTIFSCSTPLDCVWTVEAPSTGVFLVPSTGVSVYVFSDPSAGFSTTFFTGTSVGVFNGSSAGMVIGFCIMSFTAASAGVFSGCFVALTMDVSSVFSTCALLSRTGCALEHIQNNYEASDCL